MVATKCLKKLTENTNKMQTFVLAFCLREKVDNNIFLASLKFSSLIFYKIFKKPL